MTTKAVVLVLVASLLAPLVYGGSVEEPEIRDDVNEVTLQLRLGGVDVSAPEVDFSAVWFEANATHLTVSMKVLDLSHRAVPGEGFVMGVTFVNEEYSFADVKAEYFPSHGWIFLFSRDERAGGSIADYITGTVDEEQSTVTLEVPCTYLTSPLTQVVASSILVAPKPTGGHTGGGVIWFRDVAPNDTYGPDVPLACA